MQKPVWQSYAMWGAAILAVLGVFEGFGALPQGASAALAEAADKLAFAAGIFGIRRAQG